jgi:predicted phage terminase large subunit-like protein
MGTPFPRGGRVFGDVHFYGGENDPQLPAKLRIAIGIDLAYSAKTSSDYSTLIVLGIDDHIDPPRAYVLHVLREQEKAPVFAARVAAVQEGHPGVPATWYYAGVEKGIIDFVGDMGVDIDARVAAADKFIRSQPVAAAWNAGNVLVPRQSYAAPWVDDFVAELASFTGVKDRHDDQVDALAAAFDSGEQPNWVDAMEKMRARETAEALTANASGVCKCRPGLFTVDPRHGGCAGCGYPRAKGAA